MHHDRNTDTDDGKDAPMPTPRLEERVRDLEEDRRFLRHTVEEEGRLLRMTLQQITRDLEAGRERIKETEVDVESLTEVVEEMRRQFPVLKEASKMVRAGVFGVFGILGAVITGVILAVLK